MTSIDETLRAGLMAHQTQEFDIAATYYRKVLDAEPMHPEANHAVGLLLIADNQGDAAIPFLLRALQASEEAGVILWFDCLDALLGAARWDEAASLIQQARDKGLPSTELDLRELKVLASRAAQNLAASEQIAL